MRNRRQLALESGGKCVSETPFAVTDGPAVMGKMGNQIFVFRSYIDANDG